MLNPALPLRNVAFAGMVLVLAGCQMGSAINWGNALSAVASDGHDGSDQAAAASPQHPGLLSSFLIRPSWKVAGIDYAVGYAATTTLLDPSTLSISGVTVDATAHRVTVSTGNLTLNGYDFSSGGGWSVNVTGASNVTIKNSKFALTSAYGSYPAIMADASSPGLNIEYNVIDGGGSSVTNMSPNALISINSDAVIEYNWIKNAPSDLFDASATGGSLVVEFNLFENAGQLGLAGANQFKVGSGTFSSLVFDYNTVYQMSGTSLGAGGLNLIPPSGSAITSLDVGHCTLAAPGTPGVLSFGIATLPSQTGSGQVHDNYVDISGMIQFSYIGSSAANLTYSNNLDLDTGKPL